MTCFANISGVRFSQPSLMWVNYDANSETQSPNFPHLVAFFRILWIIYRRMHSVIVRVVGKGPRKVTYKILSCGRCICMNYFEPLNYADIHDTKKRDYCQVTQLYVIIKSGYIFFVVTSLWQNIE